MQAAGNRQPVMVIDMLIADCLLLTYCWWAGLPRGVWEELFRAIFSEHRRIEVACICTPQ
jgi:hypothetical protein